MTSSDGGKGDASRITDKKRFNSNFDKVTFDAEEPELIKDRLGRKTYRLTQKDERDGY